MENNIKLRLEIDVEYVPNGATEEELRAMLLFLSANAYDTGLMTGNSTAEVHAWKSRVVKLWRV